MLGRDSSAEVEYHAPRSNNPQPKKVRVVDASKPSQRSRTKAALDDKHSRVEVTGGQKPAWNSNVRRKTAPVTLSDRDPSYERRRQQRMGRQRELLAQAAANERLVPRRFVSQEHQQRGSATGERQLMHREHNRHTRQPSPQTSPARGQPLHLNYVAALPCKCTQQIMHVKLFTFCANKHQTLFRRTCGI